MDRQNAYPPTQVVTKVLREMATESQGQGFNYNEFKRRIELEEFLRSQNLPLKMRLQLLESFFKPGSFGQTGKKAAKKQVQSDRIWEFTKGSLTIVDLSCPFIGPDDACALFNICISMLGET